MTESTISQLRVRAAREALRPSRQLPITVTPQFDTGPEGTVYTVNYSGIYASGPSPEEACRNFDRVWRDGHDE